MNSRLFLKLTAIKTYRQEVVFKNELHYCVTPYIGYGCARGRAMKGKRQSKKEPKAKTVLPNLPILQISKREKKRKSLKKEWQPF